MTIVFSVLKLLCRAIAPLARRLRLTSPVWMARLVVFLALLVASGVWLYKGKDMLRRGAGRLTPDEYLEKQMLRLKGAYPDAYNVLSQLRDKRNAAALAQLVRAQDDNPDPHLAQLSALAKQAKLNPEHTSLQLLVAQMAAEPGMFDSSKEQESFIEQHLGADLMLSGDSSGLTTRSYKELLEEAHAKLDPATWKQVNGEPVMLVLWHMLGTNQKLWKFAVEQKSWLSPALLELSCPPEADPTQFYTQAVDVACDNYPHLRDAVVEKTEQTPQGLGLGRIGFHLFMQYAPMLHVALVDLKMPLAETLEVAQANPDRFDLSQLVAAAQAVEARKRAEDLHAIYVEKPSVWNAARCTPFALRFDQALPGYSQQILSDFPDSDIPVFLLSSYEKQLTPAAEAICRYGDMAYYGLKRYQDLESLKECLNDPHLGARSVVYAAYYYDRNSGCLEEIKKDPALLDKYLDVNGAIKEKPSWATWPLGGAVADLVRMRANGERVLWAEYGWAALDAFDIAVVLGSFGQASAAPVAIEGMKSGGQALTRAELRQLVQTEAKQLVRSEIGEITRAEARAAARSEVKVFARRPLSGAVAPRQSLLRRFASAGKEVVERRVESGNVVLRFGSTALTRGPRAVARIVESSAETWRSLRPASRLMVYRGLMAAGLFVTLTERTLPALKDKEYPLPNHEELAGLPQKSHRLCQQLAQSFHAGSAIGFLSWVAWLAVAAALASATWWICPFRSRTIRKYRVVYR